LDADGFEELPNKIAALSPVVIEGLVGPFPGDQHATSGDAQVLGLVGFALAASGGDGVAGSFGLDSVEQPDRAAWRAWGGLEFGVQSVSVFAVGVGGALAEASGLPDALGEVLRDALTAYLCYDCFATASGWGAHAA
jgi:hypothetical protein